jgi:hypothetical protein
MDLPVALIHYQICNRLHIQMPVSSPRRQLPQNCESHLTSNEKPSQPSFVI